MPTVVTTKSVVLSKPLLDEKNKPVTEEVKFNGRKVTHTVHEHTQHKAGAAVEVDRATAKALIAAGHAREHVAGLDDDTVDPTKATDPLA
jgi:hypothetical protein